MISVKVRFPGHIFDIRNPDGSTTGNIRRGADTVVTEHEVQHGDQKRV